MRRASAGMIVSIFVAFTGCSSAPAPEQAVAAKKAAPKPADDTRRFPQANQTESHVVDEHLLGHSFLPGGNIAHYKKGKQEYDLILIKSADPGSAALLLLEYKHHLKDPKLIAHFGGYAGDDEGKPAFVFTKGAWLCAVIGLPEQDADLIAREFAARLN